MSYAKVISAGLVGVRGHLVEVEVDLANGLPGVVLSGLPDTALNEARDRVRAAIVNSGHAWPSRRITINLLPAALPKHGSGFDLAVACAVLTAAGELPPAALHQVAVVGELGLDGSVRPVRGVLPMVLAAARAGVRRVVVPEGNAAEAALIPGLSIRATDTLHRLIGFGLGHERLHLPPPPSPPDGAAGPDLADVVGQPRGRRALEVAAAGGHHMAMVGPPGAGKTMLAQRLPSILPELDDEAALEVTALHSVAGVLPTGARLRRRPPFQAPTTPRACRRWSVAAPAWPGRGRCRSPTGECCSWTRRRSSARARWRRCASHWRTGWCACAGRRARPTSRPASS
jgi:magnesium chelatase family protein